MPDGLYDQDVLLWSEQQATLLRRLEAGERVNDAIDWPNLIEELQDVGRSELHAVESLLQQALMHLLKRRAWPASSAARPWQSDMEGFLGTARRTVTPSMRQRIDLGGLYRVALRQVQADDDASGAPCPLPDRCPYVLDDLLADTRACPVQDGS
jgi:hypothetical protein